MRRHIKKAAKATYHTAIVTLICGVAFALTVAIATKVGSNAAGKCCGSAAAAVSK